VSSPPSEATTHHTVAPAAAEPQNNRENSPQNNRENSPQDNRQAGAVLPAD
jgi:hypothetical protein